MSPSIEEEPVPPKPSLDHSDQNNSSEEPPSKNKNLASAPKDSRSRIAIFSLLAILVILVATAWVFFVWQPFKSTSQVDSTLLESGGPITIGRDGVGSQNKGVPIIEEYFSYSCHHCADFEAALGPQLYQAALDGKITYKLHPVDVVNLPYRFPATAAAITIAQKEPEHFHEFHRQAFKFFSEDFQKSGDTVQDLTASTEKIKEIALSVGVSPELANSLDNQKALDYLEKSQAEWVVFVKESKIEKPGTPMFVRNGKVVTLDEIAQAKSADEAIEILINGPATSK